MEDKEKDMDLDDKKDDFKKEAKEWVKSIILAVVIAVVIKNFIFNTTFVMGNSMYPTLLEKDRLIAWVIPARLGNVKRDDIVVLKAPDVYDKNYIKRVIGIPGDKIEIRDGRVYRNGDILEEEYIAKGSYTLTYDFDLWEVEDNQVFVLGDNREDGASKDSRYFGCIPIKSIKGVAKFRFYPINNRFGKLK